MTQLQAHSAPNFSEHYDELFASAQEATTILKVLAHEGRLMILCNLTVGEKTVTELEKILGSRQAAVSQQLSRLRMEGLVSCRREGKTIYYKISDARVEKLLQTLYEVFCS